MKHLAAIGRYMIMLKEVFKKPTKKSIMKSLIYKEIDELIFGSLGIVIFISFFIGGVVAIQTALNLENPLIPKSLIGFATRQSVILEFAPTLTSIVLAGKIGSFITSSIGTMRVTEQIDALEVMGVNPLNYLVYPKIIALLMYPFIIAIAMYMGVLGGYSAINIAELSTSTDFIEGIRLDFDPYHVTYAFIKTIVFAFLLATIPSYHGYYMKGGALDVGKASTTAFVWTTIVIIVMNYVLTQLILG
ncbi:MAG: ABC transporter permease [Flavobacteriaceae bacterium]|jgi:phospholipid/cholesterol/gamma-HCH transport system permease protein|nr:ABC transporter permease [Flavobacteriaceae bacterium]NVJ72323.1 ABC transporter permease [Flavobacteriaceae bacterium]